MRTAFFVGCVSIGIILLLGIPKRVFAASCSVSASGSLVPGVSGDVTVSVQNIGSDTISWVYLYTDASDMEVRSASSQGAWVGSVQDPQRVEYVGGAIDPSATTSFSLSIVGNTVGTYSLAVQAAQSSDGSGRVDCGAVSVNVADAPTVGIANIVVTEVGSSTVKVTWTTDTAATATISYGKTTEYGLTATQSTVSTTHSVSLGDLDANTTYHYRVQSSADGVTQTSTDQTFVTAKAGSTGTNQPASSTTSTSAVAAATPTPLPDRNAPTVRILTSFAEPFITAPTIDLTHALANPEESPVERANSRIFRVSIIGFCCIAVLAGVLAVLSQRMDTNERRQLVSEEAAVPVPTPAVSVQTMFTIAVQNGTGKAGEASRMAERLTGAGFSVGSIGNAPARETQTSLHVRPSDALRIDDLIASLSSIVTVSSHAADLVDGTESARLILGR